LSYLTMQTQLQGDVPNVARVQAQNAIRRALGKIYDDRTWSFQAGYAGWLAGWALLNTGTYTVTPFSPYVVADAVATAAIAAMTGRPLITELQYRDPNRYFYSIIGYDTTTNAPFATLTLDRPWMEPTSGPGQSYMIYQALFPAPFKDFRGFSAAWNTTDAWPLDFSNKSQMDLAREDPQRLIFDDPRYIVKYGDDQRPGSATLGFQLYELWPNVLNPIPVSFGYERRGPELVYPNDCVVYPLTEELVMWRAKEELYDVAEATKGKDMARGQGANFEYLSGKAHAQYEEVLVKITAVDANLRTDLIVQTGPQVGFGEPYSTRTGGLNVGGYSRGG
jgi:hypothetical protein